MDQIDQDTVGRMVHHEDKRTQFKFRNVLVVLAMGMGSVGMGYSGGVITASLAQPTFIKHFSLDTRSDVNVVKACMTAFYFVGGFIASFIISFMADRWGRKWAIAVAAFLIIISGACLAGSVNATMFIIFRFVSGAGGNIMLVSVPVWMTCYLGGWTIALWVGLGFYFLTPHSIEAWRGPFALQCFFPLILLSGLYWMPESPRWLLMHDRYDEAQKVLLSLHTREEAAVEYAEINAQMHIDRTLGDSYWDLIRKPSYRKRAIIAFGTMSMCSFSGILVIVSYGPTIYSGLGYGTVDQLVLAGGWQAAQFVCGIAAVFFIDKFTRPHLFMLGLFGCLSCLVVEAGLDAKFANSTTGSSDAPALKVATAMIFIFAFFWAAMLDGTQWAYLGEIFPAHLRAKGVSLGMAGIEITNIIFLMAAPTAFSNIGWRYYLVFIIPCLVAILLIYLYFPDTCGVPLEETAAIFGDYDELYIDHVEQGKLEVDAKATLSKATML